jgi:hypothetical protein
VGWGRWLVVGGGSWWLVGLGASVLRRFGLSAAGHAAKIFRRENTDILVQSLTTPLLNSLAQRSVEGYTSACQAKFD